jgi:hypothetical protein
MRYLTILPAVNLPRQQKKRKPNTSALKKKASRKIPLPEVLVAGPF